MSVAVESPAGGPITYGRVLRIALPVVLSNATVPLQGAVDTAIIGNLGETEPIAAATVGAAIVTLMFGVFNFLQFGTSGLAAQARGAGVPRRVLNVLLRALLVALVVAAGLLAIQAWSIPLAMRAFEASAEAEALASGYVAIRLWGGPFELMNYALIGWFTAQELTRRLFEMQIVVSVVNIALNLIFVLGLGWGVEGVALGTVLAQGCGLAYGGWRAAAQARVLRPPDWRLDWARLTDRGEVLTLMALNRDIFVRTTLLMASFTWFARLGSTQGDVVLAANGILMQFLFVTAYALDGFAMAAETLVGQALGARSRARLRRAILVSTVAATGLAAAFSVALALGAPWIVAALTNVPEVRQAAMAYALWAASLPLAGVLTFQADGIFIGAAEGPAMRNAMVVAAGVFFPASWLMLGWFGNGGLWAALILFMLLRAVALAWRYPALEARTS